MILINLEVISPGKIPESHGLGRAGRVVKNLMGECLAALGSAA